MKATQGIPSLRAGVIGTGSIGPVHVEALCRLGVTVTAICDVANLATNAAVRLGIPEAFTDYRDLLRGSDGNAVHMTTPNRFGAEMSVAALCAGKRVVYEKRLAMDTRETDQIVKEVAAGAAGA